MLEVLGVVVTEEILKKILVTAFSGIVLGYFINLFREAETMPEHTKAPLSEIDEIKANETKNLIREKFGNNVTETIRGMSNIERLKAADDFAKSLSELYGLDIKIDVNSQSDIYGYYNFQNKQATFSVLDLWVDNEDKNFDKHIQNFFDTVVHELRHAVQYDAVHGNNDIWMVDEERRQAWEDNFKPGHYINPDVNARGYFYQPVENDAYTFAAYVVEGVFLK